MKPVQGALVAEVERRSLLFDVHRGLQTPAFLIGQEKPCISDEGPSAADLEKAHLILDEFGLLIGPAGRVSDIVAGAVAAGIALGRKEGRAIGRRHQSESKGERNKFCSFEDVARSS